LKSRGGTEQPVALLTGGGDRPYALGLASSLIAEGVSFDFIGSDELESPLLRKSAFVRFLNLRGDMRPEAPRLHKAWRLLRYYVRLLAYAMTSRAEVFHLLWNNKFEHFDRTVVLSFYKLLGKRIAFTVHNVNIRKRDGHDNVLNRLTLRYQYWVVDHLFVHTQRMADELGAEFGVPATKVSVIPFGINSTVPDTALTTQQARLRLGLGPSDKVLLFFGNIARYKGLDLLVEALPAVLARLPDIRLLIAGRPKGEETYWAGIERRIGELGLDGCVTRRIEYVPDDETELYFKAADLLVLPYIHVFQSGVLFLGYNFGLPAVAADVGSLREEIVEGETGYICTPTDPVALATALVTYFGGALYRSLDQQRAAIRRYAAERYSWSAVASISVSVYRRLAADGPFGEAKSR
jgi:glycosyltransferase involved in cell wall biosynthesis